MATFIEMLEAWFELNEVTEKKNLILISALDAGTYEVLRNVVAPRKPTELDYAELVSALESHFNPTPIVVGERFKFWKRDQKNGESVNEYALELRKLTRFCDFGAFLDEALRDKLVCGLRDEGFQKRLLSEPRLDFKQALSLAQALEQAACQAASFHEQEQLRMGAEGAAPVNRVQVKAEGSAGGVAGLATLTPCVGSSMPSVTSVAKSDISSRHAPRPRITPIWWTLTLKSRTMMMWVKR